MGPSEDLLRMKTKEEALSFEKTEATIINHLMLSSPTKMTSTSFSPTYLVTINGPGKWSHKFIGPFVKCTLNI